MDKGQDLTMSIGRRRERWWARFVRSLLRLSEDLYLLRRVPRPPGECNSSNICAISPDACFIALAALAGSQLRTSNTNRQQPAANNQTHEMTVPNELIGCIIGKGGTKIAEIRQISGAMIRISNCEEREGGATDRTITITGNPDAVALAQYLINMR